MRAPALRGVGGGVLVCAVCGARGAQEGVWLYTGLYSTGARHTARLGPGARRCCGRSAGRRCWQRWRRSCREGAVEAPLPRSLLSLLYILLHILYITFATFYFHYDLAALLAAL